MRKVALVAALTWIAGALAAPPAGAVNRRAFATMVGGPGNLSVWPDAGGQTGLAAGDAICRARAAAAGLPNANTYRAWLSTATVDAYCHVRGQGGTKAGGCTGGPPQAAGPWYLVNGITPFTAGLDDLTGPEREIYRAVLFDENGTELPSYALSLLWTGTDDDGTATAYHCSGWTTASSQTDGFPGVGLASAQLWTIAATTGCNTARRLLCLEPGVSAAAPPRWLSAGAIAFVTSQRGTGELGSWPEAGGQSGLAAGDAICRDLAQVAHLPAPESFVAWLSDSNEDAGDRVTTNGPFRRIDGLVVANTKADLVDGSTDVSLHVDELGQYVVGEAGGSALTGTDGFGVVAPGEHCLDWTSADAGETALVGVAALSRNPTWTAYGTYSCAAERRLYCFSNVLTLFWDGFELTGDTSRWSSVVP